MDMNKFVNKEEAAVYNYYFDMCDIDRCARVFPLAVALLLRRSLIGDDVLANIWQAVDPSSIGWLDRKRFYIGLKLTAGYQNQKALYSDFNRLSTEISHPTELGPLPVIELPVVECELSRLIEAEQEFIDKAQRQPGGRWLVLPESSAFSGPTGNRFIFCSTLLGVKIEDVFSGLDAQFQSQFRGLAVQGELSGEKCRQISSVS